MSKVKSLDDLIILREEMKSKLDERNSSANLVQIKVAMATCGIASGAKDLMEYLIEELDKRNIEAVVTQTGCMGYCYAEPTIEVTLPKQDPIVFGYVNLKKGDEIIEKYIKNNELVDGIIPVNYESIEKN